jgi:hypothetical protein
MFLSVRRAVIVLIFFSVTGLGLLALAAALFEPSSPVNLPPPFFSTQPARPPLSGLPLATPLADAPILTIAAAPYHHPSGAFTIAYPDGWQIDESEDSVQFTAPEEDAGQFSVTFVSGAAASDGDYARDLQSRWGDLAGFVIQKTDATTLPDHWSAMFTFNQTLPPNQASVQIQGMSVYWPRTPLLYMFVALAPQHSSNWPVLQSIANSLQTYPNLVIADSE